MWCENDVDRLLKPGDGMEASLLGCVLKRLALVQGASMLRDLGMQILHQIQNSEDNGHDDDDRRKGPGQVLGRGRHGAASIAIPIVPVAWIIDVDLAH